IRSPCHHCARATATSASCPDSSCSAASASSACAACGFATVVPCGCRSIHGRATCANWNMRSRAPWSPHPVKRVRANLYMTLRALRLCHSGALWLQKHPWPGNVRELEHAISRAVVRALSEGHSREHVIELTPQHLGADPWPPESKVPVSDAAEPRPRETTLHESVEHFRRELVRRRLRSHKGNLSATAASLGVDKGNFHRMVKRLGLR